MEAGGAGGCGVNWNEMEGWRWRVPVNKESSLVCGLATIMGTPMKIFVGWGCGAFDLPGGGGGVAIT